MNLKENVMNKINSKEIVVGVVGLGYVGLPLAVEQAKSGYKTIGFEVQKERVDQINDGINYIEDVVDSELEKLINSGMLRATIDFSHIKNVNFIAICVPTPLDEYQQPDISYIETATKEIASYMQRGTVVVLESTTYPGTTEELIMPILESFGLKCGEDFYLAFSPERVDPGNQIYRTKNTPKVVGGVGKEASEIVAHMYRQVLEGEVIEVSSPKVAEMEKILENTYRNINIGLANEMAIICEKMGINVWEVIDAAKTKPYGFAAFYPGAGLGGHCIPLDPYYLSWKAKEYNYHMKLIETSGEINNYMPQYVVKRVVQILNKLGQALSMSKILVLGVAYKQDIGDYRESPALKVINNLKQNGSQVEFYDPYIKEFKYRGEIYTGIDCLQEKDLTTYDIIIITTNHSSVNYNWIQQKGNIIFDTKNAMKDVINRENIVLL